MKKTVVFDFDGVIHKHNTNDLSTKYEELIRELKTPLSVDGVYIVDHYRRDAISAIEELLALVKDANDELKQKEEYYNQMVDALSAIESKELTETKRKLKHAENRELAAKMVNEVLFEMLTSLLNKFESQESR